MADELIRYVEDLYKKGYNTSQIKEMLSRSGYSSALVDGVIQSVQNRNTMRDEIRTPINNAKNPHATKIILVSILAIVLISAGIFLPSVFSNNSKPLLDLKTTQDSESYKIGDDVGFDLEIINMGSIDRFDIILSYRILDSNDNLITSKEETVAISASTSYHKNVRLPTSMKTGIYHLKVFANYEGKLATSSFSFNAEEKDAVITKQETCTDKILNQNEVGIDCGGICGGYWYDETCNSLPKKTNTTIETNTPVIKETCSDKKTNQNEIGPDCGGVCGGYWYDSSCHNSQKQIENNIPNTKDGSGGLITSTKSTGSMLLELRLLAKTDPDAAKQGCINFNDEKTRDSCLKSVAQNAANSDYCELVIDDNERDLCYYPFFMQGDYTVCEKLVIKESLDTCAQLKQIAAINTQ